MDHNTAATSKSSTTVRYSSQAITEMLAEFDTSKFTVAEYCEYKGLNESTFHGWLNRQRNKEEKQNEIPAYVPFVFKDDEPKTEGLFAEVRGIKIYQRVDAAYLKELLS